MKFLRSLIVLLPPESTGTARSSGAATARINATGIKRERDARIGQTPRRQRTPPFSLNRSTRNRQCRFRFGFYAEGVTEHSPGSPRLGEAHPGNSMRSIFFDATRRVASV